MKRCNPIEGLKEAHEKFSSPGNSSEEVPSIADLRKISLTSDNNTPTFDTSNDTQAPTSRPLIPLAPKRAKSTISRKNTSEIWDHFTKNECENKDDLTATYNYCGNVLACPSKSGTSCLRNHLSRCKKYHLNVVDKRQKTLFFQQESCDLSSDATTSTQSSFLSWKFDQDLIRETISQMIIIDELPFNFVEREGFPHVMTVAQPRFQMPSRKTIAIDCFKIYFEESEKLKKFFSKFNHTVCLTTDTWTNC